MFTLTTCKTRSCPEQTKGALEISSLNNLGVLFHTPSRNVFKIHRKTHLSKLSKDSTLGIYDILNVLKRFMVLKALFVCGVGLSTRLSKMLISSYPGMDRVLKD